MRKVILAETAGFCFGVARAVNLVESSLQKGEKVCTLGPIIHNRMMTQRLAEEGARVIDSPEEALPDETVVLRSHGVEADRERYFQSSGQKVLDGTCPFVAKIHKIVTNASLAGDIIVLMGDLSHPEVKATLSRCTGEFHCVSGIEEAEALFSSHPEWRETPVTLLAQTTASAEGFEKIKKFTNYFCTKLSVFDTICEATAKRQAEAELLAEQTDGMLVIGSSESSNTGKLLNICRAKGPAWLVENVWDIPTEELSELDTIGITAGASAPVFIIKEVYETCLKNCGRTFPPR